MDCKSSIPSSNLGVALIKEWGYGGMVDTTDLKSVDLISRESSSLSTPNILTFLTQVEPLRGQLIKR